MERVILNSRHLADFFDRCIEELKQRKNCAPLIEMSSFLGSIGEMTGDLKYYAIQPFIGMIGSEISGFLRVIDIPILPEELRTEYQRFYGEAVDEIVNTLEVLKNELCQQECSNSDRIIEALGKLGKYVSGFYDRRVRAEKIILPYRSPSSE